jgi:hypothetical protein
MEASKLTVDNKTYELNKLGRNKKTSLRRKLLVDYIQSKPAGTIITLADLMGVGQITSSGWATGFVQRMIRDGVIARYDGDRPRTHYYGVLTNIRSHKIEPVVEHEIPVETPVEIPVVKAPVAQNAYEIVLGLAKDFWWEERSIELRAFVEWVKAKNE